jgi:hypothetical protein
MGFRLTPEELRHFLVPYPTPLTISMSILNILQIWSSMNSIWKKRKSHRECFNAFIQCVHRIRARQRILKRLSITSNFKSVDKYCSKKTKNCLFIFLRSMVSSKLSKELLWSLKLKLKSLIYIKESQQYILMLRRKIMMANCQTL